MARVRRIYEPAWVKLKTDKRLTIAAAVHTHKHIIRMVCKEKYQDAAYKFELAEDNKQARLEYQVEGNKIKFKLIEELSPDAI